MIKNSSFNTCMKIYLFTFLFVSFSQFLGVTNFKIAPDYILDVQEFIFFTIVEIKAVE